MSEYNSVITCRTGERAKDYKEYLKTKHWRETKIWAKKSLSNKCHVCGSLRQLQVHHRSYKHLGNELIEDLEILCRGCHRGEHGLFVGKEYSPTESRYINGDHDELPSESINAHHYKGVHCVSTGENTNTKDQYESSDYWKRFRFDVISRVAGHCQCCGLTNLLDIHHIHYETLGNEDLCDIVPLCKECHDREHSELEPAFAIDSFYSNATYLSEKFFHDNALTIVKAMRGNTEDILTVAFNSRALAKKVMLTSFYRNHPLLNR